LLSGGVDSSLIAAMASDELGAQLRTFTVVFPGHRVDESPYARVVARHIGSSHVELTSPEPTPERFTEIARYFDDPIADASNVLVHMLSELVRQHVIVALGGDGGDELFGGYPHYQWVQIASRVRNFAPSALRAAAASGARFLPIGTRWRHHAMGLGGDIATTIAHVNLYFDERTRARLLGVDRLIDDTAAETVRKRMCDPRFSPVEQAMRLDFQTYLPDDLLTKIDRAVMAHSLELRSPFLSREVVEFAFGTVPKRLKVTSFARKILLRRVAEKYLPAELDLQRKHGFTPPLSQWWRGPLGTWMTDVLLDSSCGFDRGEVRRLLAGQQAGRRNEFRLFALAIFEVWRRGYGLSVRLV
jgi:asparagine synthase (glutamine-hydrolysing)